MLTALRTSEEIRGVRRRALDWVDAIEDRDFESNYSGLSYEEGVLATLRWLFKEDGESPIPEEDSVENVYGVDGTDEEPEDED